MTIDYQIGDQAKLYYHATAATALLSMTELSAVKDVNVGGTRGLADITTRANSGWRSQAPTLGDLTITFTLLWSESTAAIAIKDAFTNRTTLDFAALTGPRDVAGHEGPRGTFFISEFTRDEPLEDGITYSVTAVMKTFIDWEVITT